ncbi:MAG: hypothetical protein R2812_06800 [Gelidibacter sp.]
MKHLKFIMIAIFIATTASCSKDDSDKQPKDINQLVENFVTPSLKTSLEQLGFNFNDGVDQPDISGTFFYSTHVLQATNIEDDDPIGTEFVTSTFTFSNLNPENRTFSFSGMDGGGASFGNATDTFYSGTGNKFSAYVKFTVTSDGETAIALLAISGTISESGILDAQDAILMLDNMGNPTNSFIENGKGRLFIDGDGTAERL